MDTCTQNCQQKIMCYKGDDSNLNCIQVLQHKIPDLGPYVHEQELETCWGDGGHGVHTIPVNHKERYHNKCLYSKTFKLWVSIGLGFKKKSLQINENICISKSIINLSSTYSYISLVQTLKSMIDKKVTSFSNNKGSELRVTLS